MQREKPDVLPDEAEIRMLSEYRLMLFAEARRHCDDVGDAEELVLRTIDAALRDWESCQNKDSPLPWLLGILRNIRSKDVRRMVERNTVAVDPDILAANEELSTNETDDAILRNSDSEAVREAIGRLAPEYKKTVVMHYMMDMPLKEIAKVLRRPIGTVKWRLSVAKGVLAGMLKRSLGRPGTWAALALGLLVGCTAAVIVMRLPARRPTDPEGGIVYNTPRVHEITVRRAPREVKIDGDLSEWTPPVFEAACNPPYDRDYRASIRIMWDEKRLYIAGDIRTPDPMRNIAARRSGRYFLDFAGGSVICRLAVDDSCPWPLPDSTNYWPHDQSSEPYPDEKLVSIVLYHDSLQNADKLCVLRYVFNTKVIDVPDDAWCGTCREHSDGRGYTFEYAMEWVAAGITPPKPGETRPNNWNIHFSNVRGMSCCGQIIENVLPDSQKRIEPSQLAYLYKSPLWGKMVFE